MAAIEAMALGLPVITTLTGFALDLAQHGDSIWIIPPANSVALAEAIVRIANDRALRERMGKRASTLARQLTVTRFGEQLERIYLQAIRQAH